MKTLKESTNLKLDFLKPGTIVSNLQSNDKHHKAIRLFFFWHCRLQLSLLLYVSSIPLCKILLLCYGNICPVKLNTVYTISRNACAMHRHRWAGAEWSGGGTNSPHCPALMYWAIHLRSLKKTLRNRIRNGWTQAAAPLMSLDVLRGI